MWCWPFQFLWTSSTKPLFLFWLDSSGHFRLACLGCVCSCCFGVGFISGAALGSVCENASPQVMWAENVTEVEKWLYTRKCFPSWSLRLAGLCGVKMILLILPINGFRTWFPGKMLWEHQRGIATWIYYLYWVSLVIVSWEIKGCHLELLSNPVTKKLYVTWQLFFPFWSDEILKFYFLLFSISVLFLLL